MWIRIKCSKGTPFCTACSPLLFWIHSRYRSVGCSKGLSRLGYKPVDEDHISCILLFLLSFIVHLVFE